MLSFGRGRITGLRKKVTQSRKSPRAEKRMYRATTNILRAAGKNIAKAPINLGVVGNGWRGEQSEKKTSS